MKPEIFPNENIKTLYESLESYAYSEDKKYLELKKFGLVSVFKLEGKVFYLHPNHQWKTFMFRIPICSAGKAQERTNRSKFIALKSIIVKWVFNFPLSQKIEGENYEKLRNWFAKHMTGFATISIPSFKETEFLEDYKRTQNEILHITPNIQKETCPECHHAFIANNEETMVQCNKCGFTYIK